MRQWLRHRLGSVTTVAAVSVPSIRPHDLYLRVRHPEEGPAQQPPHVRQRQREGGVPRLGAHRPEIPAGHRRQVQHPLPPQHPRRGPPGPRRDLPGGRPHAGVPGRLRGRPRHVPAAHAGAGGEGVAVRRREAAHHPGLRVQHDHVPARVALAAPLRVLRLARRPRARVSPPRSERLTFLSH